MASSDINVLSAVVTGFQPTFFGQMHNEKEFFTIEVFLMQTASMVFAQVVIKTLFKNASVTLK